MIVNNSSNVRDSWNYHINYHDRLMGLSKRRLFIAPLRSFFRWQIALLFLGSGFLILHPNKCFTIDSNQIKSSYKWKNWISSNYKTTFASDIKKNVQVIANMWRWKTNYKRELLAFCRREKKRRKRIKKKLPVWVIASLFPIDSLKRIVVSRSTPYILILVSKTCFTRCFTSDSVFR